MKVLLVNPNRVSPPVAPIGLEPVADELRAAGHETSLLDLCFSDSPEADVEAADQPDLVGVTIRNIDDLSLATGAFYLPGIRDIVHLLRDHFDAPIVLGGAAMPLAPEAIVDYCGADFAIVGPGESSICRLVDCLDGRGEMDAVPGLLWWDTAGLRRNPPSPPGACARRTRSLIDNARYLRAGARAGFETKRGCPMECAYCAESLQRGRGCVPLPAAGVVDEMRKLLEEGIDTFHACDCAFNVPLDHARAVCAAIIDAGLGERIRWRALCAPVPFDADTARLFRAAGCDSLEITADSGSREMLRRLGRHFGPEDIAVPAAHCRESGIPFQYDLIVGAPGETVESARETLERVRAIGPDSIEVSVGIRVYAGTAMGRQVRAAGPLEANRELTGARLDNEELLKPVYAVSPALGPDPVEWVRAEIGGDPRFFLQGRTP